MQVPQTEITVRRENGAVLLQKTVPPGDYVLGRAPEVELSFEADLVSRRHAQLTINFDQAFIQDLGSSNGTLVNGQPVTEITRLWPNQKIQIGAATVELRRVKTMQPPDVSLAPAEAAVQRLLPEELLRERKYDIGKVVARGGMGAILNAKDAATERTVAMKVMLDASSPDALARFVAEARVTAQLEHPNIVPVHELSVDETGQPYYTMKMVRGITLRKVLELLAQGVPETARKYPLLALLTVFQKACDALAFAHSKGVIHRDLKPENLMLDDFGVVLVMDWGLAKVTGKKEALPGAGDRSSIHTLPPEATGATLDGTIMGTPAFMSPEQARGEVEDLDPRSDIYALGAILFQILHMRPPYSGRSVAEIVDKVQRGEVAWPDAKSGASQKLSHLPGGSIPESLLAVCKKALAFDRSQRYSTIEELQRDLAAYQTGFATSAENAGFGKQLVLLVKRHKGIFATSVAAWIVITVLAVWFVVKITASEHRATRALADLQKTAPTLIAEGRKLIDAQQFDDALARISFAVTIDPKNAGYRLLRAQLLQSMLRLEEAAAEFRSVLALGPEAVVAESAQANLALCSQLLAKYHNPKSLDAVAIQQLYDQLRHEGRNAEAVPLAARLGKSRDALKAVLESKLVEWRKLPGWEMIPESERVRQNSYGSYDLDFGQIPLTAAPALVGLPVNSLAMQSTGVSDLRPLVGLSLTFFNANSCRITDLSPLHGMPIRTLYLDNNPHVRDLSPLQGMPLRNVRVTNTEVEDLRPLGGSPVTELNVDSCLLKNLNTLAGLPLRKLEAERCTELTDISALRNMPLREINLVGCFRLRDFSPLLDCPRLEYAGLPEGVREVEVLRGHPRIWRIGSLVNSYSNTWPPAEQFWDEFSPDIRPNAESELLLAKARAAGVAVGKSPTDDAFSVKSKGVLSISFADNGKAKRWPDYRGLPVTWLHLRNDYFLKDPPLLSGLPLRGLGIEVRAFSDLTPLSQCKDLRFLALVQRSKVSDLSPLRGLPLTRVIFENTLVFDLAPLRGMPLRTVWLHNSRVSDLSPLAEMNDLRDLSISMTKVADLRPLQKLRLERLIANNTPINNIAPLAGMPLRAVYIDHTAVRDLRPLLDCPDLEEATIPHEATNVEVLRHHPKLQRLSYDYDSAYEGSAQTVEEFWKEYDSLHATK